MVLRHYYYYDKFRVTFSNYMYYLHKKNIINKNHNTNNIF